VGKRASAAVVTDPVASARAVGLRYVSDAGLGIRRKGSGKGFRYVGPDGRAVRDPATLARIRALAIPPAWTEVWICPTAGGHLQATGRDARGRKQYRYHPKFRAFREETKFARMIAFAQALPGIRRRVARDLARRGLPREKVLATVVRLLETTLIRVGNEEYAKTNRSFGLTTLRENHVAVRGNTLRFEFRGKAGKRHRVAIEDARIARIVRRCQDLPGQELFHYEGDDGALEPIDSEDVNDYLRAIAGDEFSAKDFRTWAGTVLATLALQELESFDSKARAKKNVVRAIESVAAQLGNTPAICKRSYVHPAVIETYLDGQLAKVLKQRAEQKLRAKIGSLRPEETAVLALLQQRLTREVEKKAA
jgi:DNA topoisomerase-1